MILMNLMKYPNLWLFNYNIYIYMVHSSVFRGALSEKWGKCTMKACSDFALALFNEYLDKPKP